jgi:hypothetical protein
MQNVPQSAGLARAVSEGAVVACCAFVMLGFTAGQSLAQAEDPPAPAPNGVFSAITQGRLILELRPRYERAEQAGFADADASTLRTRLGWETDEWRGVKALIEFEDVRKLGGQFNDGVPPAEPFATIGDPEGSELNRAQIAWRINPHVAVALGRQRVAFDDERFVGPAAWRQDEQTFDAARADLTFGAFKATYVYLDRVNRVFAEELDWEGPAQLLNGGYAFNDHAKLTGFVYLLDFESPSAAVAQSSSTIGIRGSGAAKIGAVRFEYSATYARQEDYGGNPAGFDLGYVGVQATATYGPLSGRVMYESLEGDGARGFSTPLASLHPFQGWADAFTTTPPDGVVDVNAGLTLRPTLEARFFSNLALTARYHDFESERTSADLGEEVDLFATADLTRRVSVILKYADYDGPGAPPDTSRAWFGLEFKL